MPSRDKTQTDFARSGKLRYILILLSLLFLVASLIFTFPKKTVTYHGKHSSELEKQVTVDGDTERTDYVLDGTVTYAADKHYATMIRTRNGKQTLEEYFDENGAPVRQTAGHYARLLSYDENGKQYKVTYLGKDGAPILNNSGYAALIRSFNESGYTEYEHWLDLEGNPVKGVSRDYGRRYLYTNGNRTTIICLDENDEPCINSSGYAFVNRTYYTEGADNGRAENDCYFDENGSPVSLSMHQYGIHREYDALGRVRELTYLGIDGKPLQTGIAFARRTFYPDNTIETELYFDADGNPAAKARGQYGIRNAGGKTTYLNRSGEEIFDLKNFLSNYPFTVMAFGLIVAGLSMFRGKKWNICLLCLYLVFIAYMTLLQRESGDRETELHLFWSYEQFFIRRDFRIQILNNIWLFIPLGVILYQLTHRPRILFLPVLLSLANEAIQYFTGLGLAELDDVINNGLGGMIGFGIAYAVQPMTIWLKRKLSGHFHKTEAEGSG